MLSRRDCSACQTTNLAHGFGFPTTLRLVPSACLLLSFTFFTFHPQTGFPSEPARAVAPTNMATEDSVFGSGTLSGVLRVQLAYGSEHFPATGLIITELRFRPDYVYGWAFTSTVQQIQIRLSTTERDCEQLSRTFADNVGVDESVVFEGPLTIFSTFSGPPTGPKEFDIVIPLSQPFVYGPALGGLLVDIRNFSGSAASAHSGQSRTDDGASRVFGGISSTSGNWDNGVDALQVIYIPTNGPPLPPPRLTRGPYLQSSTTSNIIVRWRTSRAAESWVKFGRSPEDLPWTVSDEEPRRDHLLTLTNLAPATKYFYTVGTRDTNLAGGTEYYFFTAPTNTQSVRIWAMGDFGTTGNPYGLEENAAGVRDAYCAYAGARPADAWLALGDLSQTVGTDADYQGQFFDVYPALLRRTVIWPTIGNHDAAYYPMRFDYTNIFSPPMQGEAGGVPSNTKFYYSFDFANIHFVCLDSITAAPRTNQAMLDWLEQDLTANRKEWLIAFWHCPPYTFGTHDSDNIADTWGRLVEMREVVAPILEAHGVDLVLCGHSHVYERSYLLDGHYGYSSSFLPTLIKDSGSGQPGDTGAYLKAGADPTPHQGAVYVVVGVGGWITPLIGGLPDLYPAMFVRIRERGSLVIDVNSHRLEAVFLRETGAVADHFTIIKGAAPELLRVASYRLAGGQVRLQWKSIAGRVYRVEQSATLEIPDWLPASEEIPAVGATTGWTNTVPAGAATGFYRVRSVE